ncbi:MAG TPA: transporter substrate-binding domain-containing protein [Burkholderiaceae bacterium]|nr:transporter substrate-binding domain-containing protein [Burkholderiaceae bacterium]
MRRAGLLGACAVAGVLALPAARAAWPGPATPVRMAPEQDYGPFIFQRADGEVDGLSVQMLQLVARAADVGVTVLPARPLAEQLEAVRRGDADLVTSLRPTPERGAYLVFTRPYVTVPTVLAMRGDRPALSLAGLAGRPVAVGQGYAVEAVVRARHPGVAWRPVPDDVQALRGVVEGRFDGAVLDAASLAFIVREHALSPLRIAERLDHDYPLSFAVRKDWPELRDALDRAIAGLPAAQREAVLQRWLDRGEPIAAGARTPWATRFGLGLLAAGALIAIAFGVVRRRTRDPGA